MAIRHPIYSCNLITFCYLYYICSVWISKSDAIHFISIRIEIAFRSVAMVRWGRVTWHTVPDKRVQSSLGDSHTAPHTQPDPARWTHGRHCSAQYCLSCKEHTEFILQKKSEHAVLIDYWFQLLYSLLIKDPAVISMSLYSMACTQKNYQ